MGRAWHANMHRSGGRVVSVCERLAEPLQGVYVDAWVSEHVVQVCVQHPLDLEVASKDLRKR